MSKVTRKIGLSLGADICWPGAYEEIVKRLDLELPIDGDRVRFEVDRVTVEPFDLRQPCSYDVVIDRLTHWFHTSREWIKKAVIMDGLYVLNNPWSLQANEKHTTYAAMMHLGLPVPDTWMVPPKDYTPTADLKPTLNRYARLFDLEKVGGQLGYPMFMKPYDGGAWVGVSRIEGPEQLTKAYDNSGTRLMHLQKAVDPFDIFVRGIGIGPQVHIAKYDPAAPLHARYEVAFNYLNDEEASVIRDMTLTINAFFGWEFNSCEALRKDGVFYPIDFANACPDFQVTSLHWHFPWLVKNMVRWSLFCAATKRPMRRTLDWEPFYAVQKQDLPFRERLAAYAKIARGRFEEERFEEFCATHLQQLDEVAFEFFGSARAHELVRLKVEALFPAHEVARFTEHYWGLLQFWRKTERDRIDAIGKPAPQTEARHARPVGKSS
jgi:hypothetical protein